MAGESTDFSTDEEQPADISTPTSSDDRSIVDKYDAHREGLALGVGALREENGGGPPLDVGLVTVPLHSERALTASAPDPRWPIRADGNYGEDYFTVPTDAAEFTRKTVDHAADPYTTRLSPADEGIFEAWAELNQLKPSPEYDLRGYWKWLSSGHVPPPAHGQDHVLPADWVTPRDLSNFTPLSRYHPSNADLDIIDQRRPLSAPVSRDEDASDDNSRSYDLLGNELPFRGRAFTDELVAAPRTGSHRRSDPRLSTFEEGSTPSEWSTPPPPHVASPIERTNIARPPGRQRSHTTPRGR